MDLDERFLIELKQGQPAAYERLIEFFEAPLYRFFYCDHRQHHLAEEQTAETLGQLVRSLPTMRGGVDALAAFVFSVARHTKARGWRRPPLKTSPVEAAAEVIDQRPIAAVVVERREQLEQV